tara:strand:+ start:695 stop:1981 length:1287 start_codon:yes stop_codon:yes gene_type:complete
MKLLEPDNKDYAGVIVRLPSPVALEGLDNLVGLQVLGSQALVAKDSDYGELALVFTAGTQLSEEFAYRNNLHRHNDKNEDQSQSGYLEDNRHVRSLKLRGHRSDALIVGLDSLSYIKRLDLSQFKEGDTFDRIGDHEICRKFVRKRTHKERVLEKNKKIFSRVDEKFLPQHYDTDNYFKYSHVIPEEKEVTVTQKLHGTSIRIANTIVHRKLSRLEKIAHKVGVTVVDREYDYVYGSRRVIKDKNNPTHVHFYDTDIWSTEGEKLVGKIPKGYLVYGELVGWTADGAPLQSKYTYQVPQGLAELYVYRVATINPEGVVLDMSYDQIVEFCRDRDLKVVPLLWRGKYKDFKPEEWADFAGHETLHRYKEDGYPQAVPLDKDTPCDEGVVIRAEGIAPFTLKCKSATFVGHDNQAVADGTLDMEEEGKVE